MNTVLLLQLALIILISLGLQRLSLSIGALSLLALLALGRKVGLGKSSISKIEKGLTHISAEDAAILLEAMGEQLVLSASGIDESAATKEQKTKFITTGVSWFAEELREENSALLNVSVEQLAMQMI